MSEIQDHICGLVDETLETITDLQSDLGQMFDEVREVASDIEYIADEMDIPDDFGEMTINDAYNLDTRDIRRELADISTKASGGVNLCGYESDSNRRFEALESLLRQILSTTDGVESVSKTQTHEWFAKALIQTINHDGIRRAYPGLTAPATIGTSSFYAAQTIMALVEAATAWLSRASDELEGAGHGVDPTFRYALHDAMGDFRRDVLNRLIVRAAQQMFSKMVAAEELTEEREFAEKAAATEETATAT